MIVPTIRQVVLDGTDIRTLAEFYRQLLGYEYRPGDEPPAEGPDELEWLVLRSPGGAPQLAFQQVERLTPTTWPEDDVPMQLHLDCSVPDVLSLQQVLQTALGLGATLRLDRSEDPDEPLYVLVDPAGHPFCVFVEAPL
ncbi:VOC family protein [Klenkia terrae]|uniref:VOC family protein n=1 Tax=Klenkia terrae TaxID=1052259 RepID=A0ABU8ECF5_9ACTN|nr:VOC family protein [Klenkia terrae]